MLGQEQDPLFGPSSNIGVWLPLVAVFPLVAFFDVRFKVVRQSFELQNICCLGGFGFAADVAGGRSPVLRQGRHKGAEE